ncbi:hypothetical protein [Kingella potus]|uniref:hypothetical protein n=1 Tax=Kingella potus TaxID=265175 RepID=UPI001FD5CD93|nr:hypothetical protein [Kingella potus]UOP01362.1 hypothetical protein LVJ84_03755 [Kingella potus]
MRGKNAKRVGKAGLCVCLCGFLPAAAATLCRSGRNAVLTSLKLRFQTAFCCGRKTRTPLRGTH